MKSDVRCRKRPLFRVPETVGILEPPSASYRPVQTPKEKNRTLKYLLSAFGTKGSSTSIVI